MGSGKKRMQSKAENRAQESTALEHERAQSLSDRLGRLRGIGEEVYSTGGYDTEQLGKARGLYDEAGTGYRDFASTGGLSPEEKDRFIQRATSVVPSFYNRAKQGLSRRLALQGGYMPGYGTSEARLTRYGAQDSAEATRDAQVELAQQVRAGKLAGLGGITSTAGGIGGLEGEVAAGKRAGAGIISDAERIDIANRLASLGYTQQEIDALLGLASQKRSVLDTIKSITGIVGDVAGAIGGAV